MRSLRARLDAAARQGWLGDYLHDNVHVDRLGLWSVVGDISHGCPLGCRMCQFPARPWEVARPELVARVADGVLPHAHSLSIGNRSEPFLHGDLIASVRTLTQRRDAHRVPTVISLMTSGIVAHEHLAPELAESGLDVLWYSVDSCDPRTLSQVRPAARWEEMARDIGAVVARLGDRVHVGVLALVMRCTAPHLLRTATAFAAMGVTDFQFKQLVFGRAEIATEVIRTGDPEFRDVEELCARLRGLRSPRLRVGVPEPLPQVAAYDPIPIVAEGFAWDEDAIPAERHAVCVSPWFKVRVDHHGTVFPCPFIGEPEAALGSLLDQSFEEIVDGEKARRVRRELLAGRPPTATCSSCPFMSRACPTEGQVRAPARRPAGVEPASPGGRADRLFEPLCDVDPFLLPEVSPTGLSWTAHEAVDAWRAALQRPDIRGLNLYVHVPYCSFRCTFCRCYLAREQRDQVLSEYVDYVGAQAAFFAPAFDQRLFDCLSIGGGSPSVLSPALLRRLLVALHERFSFAPHCHKTIELFYSHVTREHVAVLREFGVRRASLGIQTTNREVLKQLRRPWHPPRLIGERLALLREGMEEINLDLIAGLPGEEMASFRRSLSDVLGLAPDSVNVNLWHDPARTPGHGSASFVEAHGEALREILASEAARHGFEPYNVTANNLEFVLVRGGLLPLEPRRPEAPLRRQLSIGVNAATLGFPVLGLGTPCDSAPSPGTHYHHDTAALVFSPDAPAYEVFGSGRPPGRSDRAQLPFKCRGCVAFSTCSDAGGPEACEAGSRFRPVRSTPPAAITAWLDTVISLPATSARGVSTIAAVRDCLMAGPQLVSGSVQLRESSGPSHGVHVPWRLLVRTPGDSAPSALAELLPGADLVGKVVDRELVTNVSVQFEGLGTADPRAVVWLALAPGGSATKREVLETLHLPHVAALPSARLARVRLLALQSVGKPAIGNVYCEPPRPDDPTALLTGPTYGFVRFLARGGTKAGGFMLGYSTGEGRSPAVGTLLGPTSVRMPLLRSEIDWPMLATFIREAALPIDGQPHEELRRSFRVLESVALLSTGPPCALTLDYVICSTTP